MRMLSLVAQRRIIPEVLISAEWHAFGGSGAIITRLSVLNGRRSIPGLSLITLVIIRVVAILFSNDLTFYCTRGYILQAKHSQERLVFST